MEYVPSGTFWYLFLTDLWLILPFYITWKHYKTSIGRPVYQKVQRDSPKTVKKKRNYFIKDYFIWGNTEIVFSLKYGFQSLGRDFSNEWTNLAILLYVKMVTQKTAFSYCGFYFLFSGVITSPLTRKTASLDFNLFNSFGLTVHKNFLLWVITFSFKTTK